MKKQRNLFENEHKVTGIDLKFFDDWKRDQIGKKFDEEKYTNYQVYIKNHEAKYTRMVSEFSALGHPFPSFWDKISLTTGKVSLKMIYEELD